MVGWLTDRILLNQMISRLAPGGNLFVCLFDERFIMTMTKTISCKVGARRDLVCLVGPKR